MRPLPQLFIIGLVAWLLAGCSLLTVRRDRAVREGAECSEWLDVSDPAPGVPAAVRPPCESTRPSSGFTGPCFIERTASERRPGVVTMTIDVVAAAAATYGRLKTSACREARQKLTMPVAELGTALRLDLSLARRRGAAGEQTVPGAFRSDKGGVP